MILREHLCGSLKCRSPDQNHKIGSQRQSFANGVDKQDTTTIDVAQNTPICDPHEISSHHQSSQGTALKTCRPLPKSLLKQTKISTARRGRSTSCRHWHSHWVPGSTGKWSRQFWIREPLQVWSQQVWWNPSESIDPKLSQSKLQVEKPFSPSEQQLRSLNLQVAQCTKLPWYYPQMLFKQS